MIEFAKGRRGNERENDERNSRMGHPSSFSPGGELSVLPGSQARLFGGLPMRSVQRGIESIAGAAGSLPALFIACIQRKEMF